MAARRATTTSTFPICTSVPSKGDRASPTRFGTSRSVPRWDSTRSQPSKARSSSSARVGSWQKVPAQTAARARSIPLITRCASTHPFTGIHEDRLSRDHASSIGQQERNTFGHVFVRGNLTQRHVGGDATDHLLDRDVLLLRDHVHVTLNRRTPHPGRYDGIDTNSLGS